MRGRKKKKKGDKAKGEFRRYVVKKSPLLDKLRAVGSVARKRQRAKAKKKRWR